MMKPFTVKLKMILMRHAHKRNMRKQEGMMKQMAKYMIVKRKSTNKDKIATISMPRVLLHPLEKSVVIPDDVISEILVKLSARSVGRFRCVCKSWLSITTNLSFIRAHTQHNRFTNQSLMVEGLETQRGGYYLASAESNTDVGITLCKLHGMSFHEVIASCDGLLYVAIFYDSYIINPLTGYSIRVPCPGIFLGFYFHHSTSKYRIIRVTNDIVSVTIVLVIGEQSWRRLPCRLPCRPPKSFYHNSLDLNGCLFWLAFKEQSHCKQPNTIMTFDTESEVYSLLSLPLSEKLLDLAGNLVDFNGELGLWVVDNDTIDVWILEECWVKRYSINYFSLSGCSVRLGGRNDLWIGGDAVFVKENELLIDISEARYLIRWNFKSGACCCYQREIHSTLSKKYRNARYNLKRLKKMGATIIHEVDARNMRTHPDLRHKIFDRIIYNYPHAGFKGPESSTKMIEKHRVLVGGFFANAKHLLSPHGEVHVTHRCNKTYNKWKIRDLATSSKLQFLHKVPFDCDDYPGYQNKRGAGTLSDGPFDTANSYTFKFKALEQG